MSRNLRWRITWPFLLLATGALLAFATYAVYWEKNVVRQALPPEALLPTTNLQPLLVAGFIIMVFTSLIALVLGHWLTRPYQQLNEVAQLMTQGDLDARLHLTDRGEIGLLAQSFNRMADQIRAQVTSLEEEQTRLNTILEQMADGIIIASDFGRIQLINPAACRLLDVTPEGARHQTLAQLLRHHQMIALWQSSLQKRQAQTATIEFQQQFWQLIVTPLPHTATYLVVLQDLTTIRHLQTVRRDFISNISHELRTPLAALRAVVETLQDGALQDAEAAPRFLTRAQVEIDTLTQMVQELLDLARIESGKVTLRLAPTPVADIFDRDMTQFSDHASRVEVQLSHSIPAEFPPIWVDAARIQQVVANLVHNGLKFTPPGGQVSLWARLKPEMVIISVRDTGSGIPTAEQERIFERFYKRDRARSGEGIGLGLAIARHWVEAHNGRIWVKSKVGKGSTFYIALPRQN